MLPTVRPTEEEWIDDINPEIVSVSHDITIFLPDLGFSLRANNDKYKKKTRSYMEVESERGLLFLAYELLHLTEVSTFVLKEDPLVAQHLFKQWLSLPEAGRLVKSLINDAKAGAVLNITGCSNNGNASTATLPSMFPAGSTPPLSPRSTSSSPRLMRRSSSGPSPFGSPLKLARESVREVIPQFYFHNGRLPSTDMKEQLLLRIDQLFVSHLDGMQVHEFRTVAKEICKLPSFFSSTIFRRIDSNGIGYITRDAFIDYWVNRNMVTMDIATQIFAILRQTDCNYLVQDDFKPILRELLATHPGLEFLQSTPEFQERYGANYWP